MCLCGCPQQRPALRPGSCRPRRQRSPFARPGCGRRRSALGRCVSATVKPRLPAPRGGLRVGEHRQRQLTRLPSLGSCRWLCPRWRCLMPLQSSGSAPDGGRLLRARLTEPLPVPLLPKTAKPATMMLARCPSAIGSEGSGLANRCRVTGCMVMAPQDDSVSLLAYADAKRSYQLESTRMWLCGASGGP